MWQSASNISGSSTLMQALEATFQQDLSGGGPVGSRITIESAGSTTLTNVSGYLLLDAAGSLSGPLLAVGDQYANSFQGGLSVLGAEWTGNGYVVAWNTRHRQVQLLEYRRIGEIFVANRHHARYQRADAGL